MSAINASRLRPAIEAKSLLLLLKLRTFIALILVFGFFRVRRAEFLTPANMVIISKHVALNAFLAIGMTFVIITGGIDLSVGSIVGLCGMVAGWLVLYGIDIGVRLDDLVQHVRNRAADRASGRDRSSGRSTAC